MDELISKQGAIDAIREMSPELFSAYQHNAYVDKQEVMIRLMALPSAQSERKKGKWIEVKTHVIPITYRCSVCGHEIYNDTENFCEMCGADMR